MKKNLLLLLTILSLHTYAQSNDIMAKAAFLKAQELYGNGDFTTAITRLDKVKELLGSTNPRVEYLLTQCYMEDNQPDKAQASLKAYFDMAEDSDPNYMGMLGLIEDVAESRADMERKTQEAILEKEAWSKALSDDTSIGYDTYLGAFPSGANHAEAKKQRSAFPIGPFTDSRDGQVYKTVEIDDQIWMAENLNYNSEGSVCYDNLDENCITYGRLYPRGNSKIVCPEGWKLPSWEEMTTTLKYIGFQLKVAPPNQSVFSKFKETDPTINFLLSTTWSGENNSSGLKLVKGGLGNFGKYYKLGKTVNIWLENGLFFVMPGQKRVIALKSEAENDLRYLSCRCIKDE